MWMHSLARKLQQRNQMSDTPSPQNTAESGLRLTTCSPKWIYHYCAVSQPRNIGETCYTDGIATRTKPIITWGDYMELKSMIVSKFEPPISPEKLTITSITLLENETSPSTGEKGTKA